MSAENFRINGNWYSEGTSARHRATLAIYQSNYTVLIEGMAIRTGELGDVNVSDRVGNIARRLQWPDGSLFETFENNTIDASLQAAGLRRGASSLTHRLESSWSLAIAAVVLVVLTGFATYRWGIPAAANRLAMALPVSVHETVSAGAIDAMDQFAFEPSTLDADRQTEITLQFEQLVASQLLSEFNYRLYFRQLEIRGVPIPNAMALPSGEIIVTDAFIDLVENPGELASVLLHEIGHVEERHGIRQVIQASTITVLASMTLGNMSGLNDLVTGVPVFLLQSNYSRTSESDADDFAFRTMLDLQIDPIHFATIIRKLDNVGFDDQSDIRRENDPGYLSSHPGSEQRALKAMEYSQQFNR